jgi:DNA-directed RNA polymerase specialized sigma24 family protein
MKKLTKKTKLLDKPDIYLTKDAMLKELIIYRDTKVITEDLGNMFILIANKYLNKHSFFSYTWKEDMVGDAILNMIKGIDRFKIDHPKANPFHFFSTIAYWSAIQRIVKEKKIKEKEIKVRDEVWRTFEESEGLYSIVDHNDFETWLNDDTDTSINDLTMEDDYSEIIDKKI